MRNGNVWIDVARDLTPAIRVAFAIAEATYEHKLRELPTEIAWPEGFDRRGDLARHDGYSFYYDDGTNDEAIKVTWKIRLSRGGGLYAVAVLGLSYQGSREIYYWAPGVQWPDLEIYLDARLSMTPLLPSAPELGLSHGKWGTLDEAREAHRKLLAMLNQSYTTLR